jgi:hypothetical protein
VASDKEIITRQRAFLYIWGVKMSEVILFTFLSQSTEHKDQGRTALSRTRGQASNNNQTNNNHTTVPDL